MKKIFYTLLILAGTTSFSCKNYLDIQPIHSLTDANAIKDLATAKASLGGVYSSFQNDDWAGALYCGLASKAGFVRFNTVDYDMSYNQLTASSSWTTFYKSLNAANFAISGIGKLPDAAVSQADKTVLIAEGRCLRAWINANLLWNYTHWWADDADIYGLLYRDEVVNLSNMLKARITVGESYQKIYDDLDFAIANLGDLTTPRYVSKQFAKALKAKLLLYRGGYRNTKADLDAALVLVNDVLANHPATFSMEANLADVYTNSWDSKENLFVKYLENDGTRTAKGGYYYTYYLSQIGGNTLPLPVGGTLTAGLVYGLDWFSNDPRWPVVTGPVRAAETWDNVNRFTFKKVARLGSYAGKLANPIDEKYAAYYFRYPELYLMKAELLARTGATPAQAIAPINEMRSKRTTPVLAALNPANQIELMDMIFKEIFTETFLENGSEFFAAVRFMKDGKPWIVTIKNGVALQENKMCRPIPDAEIVNNTLMEQNPELK
ncbi:RagB/SusD family nutrient uptake outer membrane protein [Pedobacter frigoris]|uniref:RagB/SusD family nutrient uptake outer membrane protein n=1 Tax=Pedobacter frigoris TaxID=2571272 RepID=UPI002931948A|nr:RagB/SusD family nutrient uptake outer membrane protein [Pedobacter frigoris]